MTTTTRVGEWQIEKRISLGTVGVVVLQAIGLIVWLSMMSSAIDTNASDIEKLTLEMSQVQSDRFDTNSRLVRIETLLTQLLEESRVRRVPLEGISVRTPP